MNLTIDIGNSHVKWAVFDGERMVSSTGSPNTSDCDIDTMLVNMLLSDKHSCENIFVLHPGISRAIISSVRGIETEFERQIARRVPTIRLDHTTPVPIKNLYDTPHTLGVDRLAAAVAAHQMHPADNVMVVDFGTAITIDFVTSGGQFVGGNISPGVRMRLQALHEHTASLPLCEPADSSTLLGRSTQQAIENGVMNGILFEIEGYAKRLGSQMGAIKEVKPEGLKVVMTGGDAHFFIERMGAGGENEHDCGEKCKESCFYHSSFTIFATCDLVVRGLNNILTYNA